MVPGIEICCVDQPHLLFPRYQVAMDTVGYFFGVGHSVAFLVPP